MIHIPHSQHLQRQAAPLRPIERAQTWKLLNPSAIGIRLAPFVRRAAAAAFARLGAPHVDEPVGVVAVADDARGRDVILEGIFPFVSFVGVVGLTAVVLAVVLDTFVCAVADVSV